MRGRIMSEIEKALKYFESYSTPYDRVAVQALQEKIDRDKGCEFCNSEEIDEAVAYTPEPTDSSDVIYIDFKYCPKCGRRLED